MGHAKGISVLRTFVGEDPPAQNTQMQRSSTTVSAVI